ncbi:hypothetical protein AAVH_15569 [Aphelenchoides avenae]|nr:hypothetical protein AAVH_15569 [Aphelenchus avenae]
MQLILVVLSVLSASSSQFAAFYPTPLYSLKRLNDYWDSDVTADAMYPTMKFANQRLLVPRLNARLSDWLIPRKRRTAYSDMQQHRVALRKDWQPEADSNGDVPLNNLYKTRRVAQLFRNINSPYFRFG